MTPVWCATFMIDYDKYDNHYDKQIRSDSNL